MGSAMHATTLIPRSVRLYLHGGAGVTQADRRVACQKTEPRGGVKRLMCHLMCTDVKVLKPALKPKRGVAR